MLASGSTMSRWGASSRRIASRVRASITSETTTAPSRSRHATTLALESLALTIGIEGIDQSSGVERANPPTRASRLFSYQLATDGDTGGVRARLHRGVKRVDQRDCARIDQQARVHLVHCVA